MRAALGKMNNIISLSGGKDSTDMVHTMIDRGEPIHSIVFFDTGWEFPQMYDHLDLLEKNIGIKIWRLQSRLPFEYWMTARPIIARKGENKGKVYKIGNGWPSMNRRWCTKQKTSTIECFCKPIPSVIDCVGLALDEKHRIKNNSKIPQRYPLIEYGITEKQALQNCYNRGYDWGGLYEHFDRVSCFCCPLKSSPKAWRKIREHFPELWKKMLQMDSDIQENKGFYGYKTVHDLDKRFAEEDRQGNLW